jgi:hypothetical protein
MEVIQNRKFQDAASKLRDLCRRFHVVSIDLDSGGGGLAIKDLLNDPDKCPEGEELIYDIEDPDSYLDKDMKFPKPGRHILHMINFNPSYLAEANHGLLSSLERKEYVFPTPLGTEDLFNKTEKEAEELEDQETEILATKNEIINIVLTQTTKGSPHWDTPQKRQRKDRYTAVLGGCKACKDFIKPESKSESTLELPTGGWAGRVQGKLDKNKDAMLAAGELEGGDRKSRLAHERKNSLAYSKTLSELAELN